MFLLKKTGLTRRGSFPEDISPTRVVADNQQFHWCMWHISPRLEEQAAAVSDAVKDMGIRNTCECLWLLDFSAFVALIMASHQCPTGNYP